MDKDIKALKTIAQEWETVTRIVIRDGQYHDERMQREMKRSFYTGWLACLTNIHDAFDRGFTPAECGHMLKRQEDELEEFFKELIALREKLEALEKEL